MFDPDNVGSILWKLKSGGAWYTEDHSGMQGDVIETVEVGEYNQLAQICKRYKEALIQMMEIELKVHGGDWDEIEEAQKVAAAAIVAELFEGK